MTTQTKDVARPHVLRVRVSDEEKAWLERIARQDDRSVHYVLRRALLAFYQSHPEDAA